MRGAGEVEWDDNCLTGPKSQVIEPLIRSCSQYCREDSNVKKMYIGIGSGKNAVDAMKRRHDEFKKSEGINHMVSIYKSSSQSNVREVEGELCSYFENHPRTVNRRGGGGGRDSAGPEFFVYLAMRRWG